MNEALQSEPHGEGLKLTGLEVLGFLGLKIVIPICCGLVSRALFDKYKDLQTTKKAELAMQELLSQEDATRTANDAADSNAAAANDASAPASDASAPASATPASDEEILNHTIGRLIDEGVPKARASEIAGATLKRIKNRLAEA